MSYQSALGPSPAGRADEFVPLPPEAIATRRKDAARSLTVALSKEQMRWLKDALELSGPDIDEGAVVRALVDLGRELDIDWALIAGGRALRAAVREAVGVRRAAAG